TRHAHLLLIRKSHTALFLVLIGRYRHSQIFSHILLGKTIPFAHGPDLVELVRFHNVHLLLFPYYYYTLPTGKSQYILHCFLGVLLPFLPPQDIMVTKSVMLVKEISSWQNVTKTNLNHSAKT